MDAAKKLERIANPIVGLKEIEEAYLRLKSVARHTPLQRNDFLSEKYSCNVFLKREDLQIVRSYKIRGAYNKISQLTDAEKARGVVCASAGNHAQGVAYACAALEIHAKIFMPITTPQQKIKKVKNFGHDFVEIILHGDNYDDAGIEALAFCHQNNGTFIHPFDDPAVIAGQGTVAKEILMDLNEEADFVFGPIGGGGLMSGLGSYFKALKPNLKLIGVEPAGAPAMKKSIEENAILQLEEIDVFVDGAAVKSVGALNFTICQEVLDDICLVEEGKICTSILELYNEEAIVAEPAGVLSIAALEQYQDEIRGRNVVCILSGGNNDIMRMEEIKERSLLHEGLKCYFIIRFPQRAGALRDFLNDVLSEGEDITHFEYTKKNNRDKGPALVGLELQSKDGYARLLKRMQATGINYEELRGNRDLFELLV